MQRFLACVTLLSLLALPLSAVAADKADASSPKAALQALNEFIGSWKGNGAPDKPKPASKDLWSENVSWSWRFKGDDVWLFMDIKDGKYWKTGELRFVPDKKKYQLTLTDKAEKQQAFEGDFNSDNATLTLERVEASTKETQQIKMNTTAEGVRFNFYFARKPDGRTLFNKDYVVAYNKEGESLGAKEKKNECVVSGGLGTMAVSYKGTTYYVCCSGCKDAFLENPEKFIKEYEARKAGKK
jgi:hypothetical protein